MPLIGFQTLRNHRQTDGETKERREREVDTNYKSKKHRQTDRQTKERRGRELDTNYKSKKHRQTDRQTDGGTERQRI
jgi:hypothetical protein